MKKFFSKNGIWILAAATLIAVVLCVLSSMGSTTGFLHNAAGVVTQPFRSAAASVGGWFGSISEHFQSVDTLKQENAELRKKNAELEEQVRQAQTDSEENARLRTLLNLRQQRQDFSFESAHIIERSTSNWSSAMTLSKGTSSDIAIGDCVVNEEGYLVGVITDVGLTWSTVTTILDTDSQLGAKVFRTGEVTVAMGDLSLMQQGRLKLSYLSDESGAGQRRFAAHLRSRRILPLGARHRARSRRCARTTTA